MGHKPDQRARRKRRGRETRQSIRPPKPPPFTAKELSGKTRAPIEKDRADHDAKFIAAPTGVQIAYRRCKDEIRRLTDIASIRKLEATLYPVACRGQELADTEIVRLRDLLAHPANGWDVRVAAPLPAGKPLSLVFHYDPRED